MNLPEECLLLRIYTGESARFNGHPLYESIVLKAREAGLAGATVLRSPLGFGATSHLHTAKIIRLSEDLPIIIEMVDTPEKISAFLPVLETMMKGGLVTTGKITVVRYGHEQKP